eukprot:11029101-Alexandrium_andersonii.AAC.1
MRCPRTERSSGNRPEFQQGGSGCPPRQACAVGCIRSPHARCSGTEWRCWLPPHPAQLSWR